MLDALLAEARLRWGLDPAAGLQVVAVGAAHRDAARAVPAGPDRPARGAACGRTSADPPRRRCRAATGRSATSAARRPAAGCIRATHPVGRFGSGRWRPRSRTSCRGDLAAPLYLAPVAAELAVASPWALPWISARLRAPDGCPWDREQTHESLRRHLLEEAYEVYDALAAGATPALAGELGDLLLQVVLHAQLAAEEGVFDLTDV